MTNHDAEIHQTADQATAEPRTDTSIPLPSDPSDWKAGKTFREMYLDGDSPWPEEPLLQNDRPPFEVADEYLSLLGQYTRAGQDCDTLAVRRLAGEIDVADATLTEMDSFTKAAVLTRLTEHLTNVAQNPQTRPTGPRKRAQVLPEEGRFNGPAPFFRRGRAYIQALAPAFTLAAEGYGQFVSRHPEDADQFLRAVEATEDITDLQDFIAGAVHELHRQLGQLISQPILRQQPSEANPNDDTDVTDQDWDI